MSYFYDSELDRKSSRGMIYENEELRLRTININAEVERGQSDIKRLRRENEHLRREIWTLRDECDRLNKRFKAKLLEHDHGGCSARGSVSCRHSGHCDGTHSTCNSDDSDSCDTCKGNDECSDDCCASGSCTQLAATQPIVQEAPDTPSGEQPRVSESGVVPTTAGGEVPQNLHNAFDHLSVVSEETLSNSELQTQVQNEHLLGYTPDSSGSQMTIPSIIGPLTPLTPIEQVANQLNDLQAVVPPLSYFENVLQQHMGSNIGNSPLSPTTAKVVRHTNGWDYNIQSPFAQRKYMSNTAPASPAVARAPNLQQRFAQPAPTTTLSTFAPNVSVEDVGTAAPTTTTSSTTTNTADIETVAITTMPTALNSPKHFFAPLKPRLKINTTLANKNLVPTAPPPVAPPSVRSAVAATTTTAVAGMSTAYNAVGQNCAPPDIYVANALATPYQRQQMAAAMPPPPPLPQRGSSSQTDSVNLEAILNDIETISEDILAIQMEKKKLRENHNGVVDMNKPLEEADKNKKPYRSEMNLLLQYDGANPTITPSKPATATQTSFVSSDSSNGHATRSLEPEQTDTDSPAPHMPDPMAPFPDKRTYLGFDQLNSNATAKIGGVRLQRPPLPPSQVVAVAQPPGSLLGTPVKPTPPIPPARILPPTLNLRAAGVGRLTPVGTPQAPTLEENAKQQSTYMPGLAPNKSHLYTAVANAAAKRAQFRATPSQLTGSVDVISPVGQENVNESPTSMEDAANAEAARRKARRVSIVCGETSNPATPDQTPNQTFNRSQAQIVNTNSSTMLNNTQTNSNNTNTTTSNTTTHPMAAGSCTDLPSVLVNPALKNLKQTSHSTPSTPHSARRRSNSNAMLTNNTELTTQSANNSPQHLASLQQQQPPQNINSSCSNLSAALQRKDSTDSTRDLAAEIMARSKCSRRHSDGTVVSNNTRRNSGAHHHHHHHHHHQHRASVISNNPHHSHHSHQDSNHETGTSSDHNSGSLASSRESSTGFSVRSHRRKISVSSHTGGKIPWCGCWGNGCL